MRGRVKVRAKGTKKKREKEDKDVGRWASAQNATQGLKGEKWGVGEFPVLVLPTER